VRISKDKQIIVSSFELLGNSVMVAQMTLDHLVKVRILVPQYLLFANLLWIKEGYRI
jgi:hypothetical protein